MIDDLPKQKDILIPFLRVLATGQEKSIHTITDQLAEHFQLSQKAQKKRYLHSGELIFFNVVRFSRLALAKVQLVKSPRRGFVQITSNGERWLANNPAAEFIPNKELTNLASQISLEKPNQGRQQPPKPEPEENRNPFSDMDEAYGKIHAKLKFDLYQSVMDCEPFYFEKIVIDLLINLGYGGSRREAGQAFSRSKDGGVDGVINEDRLGLDKIYVQAKRWTEGNTVSRPEIQKFVGALAGKRVKKGIFITTSGFSKEAINYADNETADYKIVLINKSKLINYMIESNTGVVEDNNYSLPIKRIDQDYFDTDD